MFYSWNVKMNNKKQQCWEQTKLETLMWLSYDPSLNLETITPTMPTVSLCKCVIKGVPIVWGDTDIAEKANAVSAKRFLRPNNGDTNNLMPTTTVLLEFESEKPYTVKLGYQQFKTHDYIVHTPPNAVQKLHKIRPYAETMQDDRADLWSLQQKRTR